MKYKLHKNVINKDTYKELQELLTCVDFPWYYQSKTVDYSKGKHYKDNEFMFTHKFFQHGDILSPYFTTLLPITFAVSNIVKSNNLLRIKANMYTNQGKNVYHGVHTDYPDLKKYTTAVYNFTTCDGGTVLYIDGDEVVIPSEENTLLVFDGVIEHKGFTQKDTKNRVLINYDFI